MVRHFVSDLDLSAAEQRTVLDKAREMKASPKRFAGRLQGKSLGMLFQKNSTRTRVSFEAGMQQLGGHAIFLHARDNQLGRGEPLADTAKVLSRYVDLLVIRTFAHADVQELADNSRVPVINGLDDLLHPCQALADLQTVGEHHSTLHGVQLVYVGDGNNMAHSLMQAGALAGMHVRIVCPKAYQPQPAIVQRAQAAAQAGARIEVTSDLQGVDGADVVYTDVWASMGQEDEQNTRKGDFAAYQVNASLMARAAANAIFLHCLPAHRGEEVTAEVIDGPQSCVFNQAENRLHAQKALMMFLLAQAGELRFED
jgi:ornithine carbamoyltransferase